jgi:glycosyltransferase involved in cell wall biosynthesis
MRYLNDVGIDTTLLNLSNVSGSTHADPARDTYTEQYFNKIINVNWHDRSLLKINKSEVKNILGNFDYIVGGDWAPYLCRLANRNLDIFIPHGTDIFKYPFPNLFDFSRKGIGNSILGSRQKQSIKNNVKHMLLEATNSDFERYIARLFDSSSLQRTFGTTPLLYRPQYNSLEASTYVKNSDYCQRLFILKNKGVKIIFHHCQQLWKNFNHTLFNKRNDILIHAFADLIHAKKIDAHLVMIERGDDVDLSKQLIDELNIADKVMWLPIMPRRDIMACLNYADVGVGELGRSYLTYSVVTEFICSKVPLIHFCDVDNYTNQYDDLYPMISASDCDGVVNGIVKYIENPAWAKAQSQKAYQWWIDNVEQKQLQFIISKIKSGN